MRASLRFSLALVSVVAAAPRADAFEKQWHFGGGLGGAGWLSSPLPSSAPNGSGSGAGPIADVDLTFGLNDQFNLLGEITFATARVSGGDDQGNPLGGRFSLVGANVGVAYTLDVLQWVPYFGVMVGGDHVGLGDAFGHSVTGQQGYYNRPDVVGALGLDYQYDRDFSLGVGVRYAHIFSPEGATSLLYATLRAQYTWGY